MSLQWYIYEIRHGFLENLRYIKVASIILFAWICAILGGNSAGPYIEGALFPVIVGTDITRAVQQDDGSTIFHGHATKLRSCYFDHVDMYWHNQSGEVRVDVEFIEPPKIRKSGGFDFGPWRVRLTRDQLMNETYAIFWHDCHPLGPTATYFYP